MSPFTSEEKLAIYDLAREYERRGVPGRFRELLRRARRELYGDGNPHNIDDGDAAQQRRNSRRRIAYRPGAVAVEAALVLPIATLLLVICLTLGTAMAKRIVLTHAAASYSFAIQSGESSSAALAFSKQIADPVGGDIVVEPHRVIVSGNVNMLGRFIPIRCEAPLNK